MICEECKTCPIKEYCDIVDEITDNALDAEHNILMAIYSKGVKDGHNKAIDEFVEWLGKRLATVQFLPNIRAELYSDILVKSRELKEQK